MLATSTYKSPVYGEGGPDRGALFDDYATYDPAIQGVITKITVYGDNAVSGINVTYAGGQVTMHGGESGTAHHIELSDNEFITRVTGRSGWAIDQLTFTTSQGKTFGPYGGDGGSEFSADFSEKAFVAIAGQEDRSATAIQSIQFAAVEITDIVSAYLNSSVYSGRYGQGGPDLGVLFNDYLRYDPSTWGSIARITVYADSRVLGISVTYRGEQTTHHGGALGTAHSIELSDNEFITQVTGRSGWAIDQLSFRTNQGRAFGPYGGNGGSEFTANLEGRALVAFAGQEGQSTAAIRSIQFAAIETSEVSFSYSYSKRFGEGGPDRGDFFNDYIIYDSSVWGSITRLTVYSGESHFDTYSVNGVLGMSATYAGGQVMTHGSTQGTAHHLELLENEFITQISGRSGWAIDQLTFTTSQGRVFGPYGSNGGSEFSVDFDGKALIAFAGQENQSGAVIHTIQFIAIAVSPALFAELVAPPTAAPPKLDIPPQAERRAMREQSEAYQTVGSSLQAEQQSYPPETATEETPQPLSQLIAAGSMPQFDLMQRVNSSVKEGVLTLDSSILEDYGVLISLVGSFLNLLTPIRNVQVKFTERSPGLVGEPIEDIIRNPETDDVLAIANGYALKISGDVTLLESQTGRLEYAEFFQSLGKPQCVFKYLLDDDIEVGAFLPGVPLFQGLQLSSPVLIATTTRSLYDPQLDSGINQGLNFFGNLAVAISADRGVRFIGDLLNVQEMAFHGAVDLANEIPQYIMESAIQRDVTLLEGNSVKLRFTRSDVEFAVKGVPPEPSLAMSNDLVMTLIYEGQETHLVFTGGVKVEAESITGSFTMNGTGRNPDGALTGTVEHSDEWREPLGIPGVIIRQLAVQVGFTYLVPWIDNVGVYGNLKIGDVDGTIAILVDTNDPDQFVLAGSTDKITLLQIMSAMSPLTFVAYQALPQRTRTLMNRVVDVALEDVNVSIVPSPTSIGGVHFPDKGITLGGRLSVFGWDASLKTKVDTLKGIVAEGEMEPIDISVSGINVLKVTGAATDPVPKMRLNISPINTRDIYVSGKVEFLKASKELRIDIQENGMQFDFVKSPNPHLYMRLSFLYADYNFRATGDMQFSLYAEIDTPLGRIKLVDVGLSASSEFRAGRADGFYASISGSFYFYGKKLSFPALVLDVPPSDFEALYEAVIQQIKDRANDIFIGDVFRTLKEWTDAVEQGLIVATQEIATVAKDVYHESKEAAAAAYKTLNRGVNEAARGIKSAYNVSEREVAKALKEVDYAADQVADAMKNVFNLTAKGAAEALRYAGYGVDEAAKALKHVDYAFDEVAGALTSAYNATNDALKSALEGADYAVDEVGKFFGDVAGEVGGFFKKLF